MKLPDGVQLIDSQKSGPTVAIFAGVHGNERAGVYALQNIVPSLALSRGRAYVVFANPPAIKANVRMLGKNLNRCFYAGNTESTPEDERARQLMTILDDCSALLDLHMFYDDEGEPFVICEDNALQLADIFDVGIISTNWTEVEPGGTDGYMYNMGKIGICIECGPLSQSAAYAPYAEQCIFQFLSYFDMVQSKAAYSMRDKRVIRAQKTVYKTSDDFVLLPGFRNFQQLKAGQTIARDGDAVHCAEPGECIIFPHYGARLGEEAYIIGATVSNRDSLLARE